ncbi:helix-turn-helix domain-containing protein [Paenibacillus sp. D51F]
MLHIIAAAIFLPLVLNAADIQEIMGIGLKQTYELLNSGKFHVVRTGRMIKVPREVFLSWLNGDEE